MSQGEGFGLPANDTSRALARFSDPTRTWFAAAFAAPTSAQAGAWDAIGAGRNALVVAPTGSGKTLSAFLWSIDKLLTEPVPEKKQRCRVLYISPLKALGVDVERNLRSPLVGIRQTAERLGVEAPEVRVGVRSGDTTAADRRKLTTTPPDILITTPESLFLMLTSQARETLRSIETVIVDEVHAVAATKRGSHLALTLERLDALLDRPAQRIGLSATVRPLEEVARYLGGAQPVEIVAPPAEKRWDLSVVVPVEDMTAPSPYHEDEDDEDPQRASSIWPHVEEHVADLVTAHRSTIVFANSRRIAERLTARLNEIAADRIFQSGPPPDPGAEPVATPRPGAAPPAQVMAQSGQSHGAAPVIAKAHHGSVSKEQRALIEDDLKSGRLPAVVATSSLELGIDMGAVDLVVQIESPPSVASALQRVGRAGHQVGEVSRGVLFPKHRGDLAQTAVSVQRMRQGLIESMSLPANPLDVLAQQIVAATALDTWDVDELFTLVRRTASYATLPRSAYDATLDLLAGRYPSEEFAELRPRIVWDRVAGTVTGRPGAQRLAVTSGGTIPDRGLFGVFIVGEGAGRRVGELDEEMVYESRVGDVFALGATSWRIEDITHDRVLVTPAPGVPGRLPFWKGDSLGRPAELGEAVGAYTRELGALPRAKAEARAQEDGLDAYAAANLVTYLHEQAEATNVLPSDSNIVVERFRDELGDWRLVVHSPYGRPVHAPWALAINARIRERYGVDGQAIDSDDGIVIRLPDTDAEAPTGEIIVFEPDEIEDLVTTEVGGSALFASRFRECAARALLLPRRDPGRRSPLWQQRQRSAALLEVASHYPSFPIILEAVRECLRDVYDLPSLVGLLRRIERREISIVDVATPSPSPYAQSLLFGYVAQFLYEGDSPLAERRAAALTLDQGLLAELLGRAELRELLDPEVLAEVESELQRLAPGRKARGAEGITDLIRTIGPLTLEEITARTAPAEASAASAQTSAASAEASATSAEPSATSAEPSATSAEASATSAEPSATSAETSPPAVSADASDASTDRGDVSLDRGDVSADRGDVSAMLEDLATARRVVEVRVAGEARWAVVEDVARLRDGLGVAVPPGVPSAFTEPVEDPVGDLVSRYARSHGPFMAADVATRLGLGEAVVRHALARLAARGRVLDGEFRPGGSGLEWCDADVLRTLRRRSLARLRKEVEPVEPAALGRFLPAWQKTSVRKGALRGVDGVLSVVDQLAGCPVPASALESLILPARVVDYEPAFLDELTSGGEVLWAGHGTLPGTDGWVSLHPVDTAELTLPSPAEMPPGPLAERLLEALAPGGAWFFHQLARTVADDSEKTPSDADLSAALWELVWSGRVSNDTLLALRALTRSGTPSHRSRRPPPRARGGRYTGGARLPARASLPETAGRWTILPEPDPDATKRAHAAAERLLDRHGVVTRGAVQSERTPGGFAAVYKVLSAFEESGRARRGYFVEGLGAAQFGTAGSVDRLRTFSRVEPTEKPVALALAATDPANPYGAALSWPVAEEGHRPGRKAGAIVVLVDGELAMYVERGGRTLLTWSEDPNLLEPGAEALAEAVRRGALGRLTVEKADGAPLLGSGDTPLRQALQYAGFVATPRGLRLTSPSR